eukprot:760327-Hanusia_phi.AAC.3
MQVCCSAATALKIDGLSPSSSISIPSGCAGNAADCAGRQGEPAEVVASDSGCRQRLFCKRSPTTTSTLSRSMCKERMTATCTRASTRPSSYQRQQVSSHRLISLPVQPHLLLPPPTTCTYKVCATGFSEICRILMKGGAEVNYAVPAPKKTTLVTCAFCNHIDAHVPTRNHAYECQRCHEVTQTIADTDKAAAWKGLAPSDHIGMTALHAAVKLKGHVDVVSLTLFSPPRPPPSYPPSSFSP